MPTFYEKGELIVTDGAAYQVEEILGKGGMARVYLARAVKLNRLCVIKVLDPDLAVSHPLIAKAFDAEASALAQMTSEHLPNVSAHGRTLDDRNALFYTMDRIAGHSLKHLLNYHNEKHGTKQLRLDQALNLASQIAQGLGKVHDYGVVHCDIKPDNVFLYRSEEGETKVKLIDFGVMLVHDDARRRAFMGTPAYAAPEQVEETDLGPPLDIFALGLVAFELVTGRWAYQSFGARYEDALRRARVAAPSIAEFGEFPRALTALVARALSLDPARRPDAFSMAGELRKIGRELAPVNPHEQKTDPNLGGLANPLATEMRPLSIADVSSTDVDVDFVELMRRVEDARRAQEVGDTEPGAPVLGPAGAEAPPPAASPAAARVPSPGVRVHRTVRMPHRPIGASPSELATSPPSVALPAPASERSGLYVPAPPGEDAAREPRASLPREERATGAPSERPAGAPPQRTARSVLQSLHLKLSVTASHRGGRNWLMVLSALVGMIVALAAYGLFLFVRGSP